MNKFSKITDKSEKMTDICITAADNALKQTLIAC